MRFAEKIVFFAEDEGEHTEDDESVAAKWDNAL